MKRPTSSDVARAAGVSRATVSFVLNDAPGQTIPPATRQAVQRAAAELGYVPSAAARSLRSGRSRLVLCVAPDWEPSAIMDETLSMLSCGMSEVGYAVAVAKLPLDAEHDDVLWSAIQAEVVVAMFDLPKRIRVRLRSMRIPVVEMYLSSRGGNAPTDDVQSSIGRLQVDHLHAAGCTQFVQVVPVQSRDHDIVRDRIAGAREAASRFGLPAPRLVHIPHGGEFSAATAADVFDAPAGVIVGVCAYNDIVASQVLAAARVRSLAAPRDFRLIGVDDDPVSAFLDPPLSSVRLNLVALNSVVLEAVREALGLPAAAAEHGPFLQVIGRTSG